MILNWSCRTSLGMREVSRLTGGTWSFIWSTGRIPCTTISALVVRKLGITRPGQSQSINSWSMYSVCKSVNNICCKHNHTTLLQTTCFHHLYFYKSFVYLFLEGRKESFTRNSSNNMILCIFGLKRYKRVEILINEQPSMLKFIQIRPHLPI